MEHGVERRSCGNARELISAAADDELGHDDDRWLADHLDGCEGCCEYADGVATLTRTLRLRAVDVEPDLVERVIDRAPTVRLGRGAWLRPALAWCGAVIAVTAVRPLFLAELDGAPAHVARHVGASALALGIGLLYVAWRPHRAAGLLPLVAALTATTLISAILDTVAGARSPLAEALHVIELVGMLLLWMVAGSPGWERVRDAGRSVRRGRGVVRSTS